MLQLKSICKEYVTGTLRQEALNNVSISFRDSEFVAVLGPSGSGKTTLLNIVGGLDRSDSGSLIINGISTDRYTDRDWDSYRNHTIGFVFQNYNLISHQSILANVELSLTIAGVSRVERRARAKKALEEVGLGDQLHKRPNQLSGGQMQRVAIARALVNEPEVLLADEPTGALDSETGLQVMELLKRVAKDHLVIMVTHNGELAETYATRIIKLKDGRVIDDSDPFEPDSASFGELRHENMGRARMSFKTALSLSFNNLLTKKGRTFLTAFAGSIGIIGIALILSLSNGVNNYINDLQKSTMASYPITLQAETYDLTAFVNLRNDDEKADHGLDRVYSNNRLWEAASQLTGGFTRNNLSAFKDYLDDESSEIHKYLGENGIVYDYDTRYLIYATDPDLVLVPVEDSSAFSMTISNMMSMSSSNMALPVSSQLLPGKDGALISSAVTDNYELVYGSWPTKYDEVVLVVDRNNELSYSYLGDLGFVSYPDYQRRKNEVLAGGQSVPPAVDFGYEDICAKKLFLLPMCEMYVKNENGTFSKIENNQVLLNDTIREKAIPLTISGIIRPVANATYAGIDTPIAYTQALTQEIIARTDASAVVRAQRADPETNVLTGLPFPTDDEATRIATAKQYIGNLGDSEKEELARRLMSLVPVNYLDMISPYMQLSNKDYSDILDDSDISQLEGSLSDQIWLLVYDTVLASGSYDENMSSFGAVSLSAPSSISLYTDTFENKDAISACIDRYNESVPEADRVTYTDYVGLLMSSVTIIVNVISYVLIAFVAVSLIVSSIMIGVITFISVLERTKEIGILRAVGASKRNVGQVFNAETFIIGLLAGVIGIGASLVLLLPINAIIHSLAGEIKISAALPGLGAVILILLSIALTLISGLIPASKAARRDPVTALRTE